MKNFKIVAEAKSLNKTIECDVSIDKEGNIITQYDWNNVRHPGTKEVMKCLIIPKKEIKRHMGVEINTKTATVPFSKKSIEIWNNIKSQARQIGEDYKKNKSQNFWKKCLRENATLTLSCVEGNTTIFGLPEALKDKNSLLVSHIKKEATKEKTLTTKELVNWIKTLEQKRNNRNDLHKSKLIKKAKKTGSPQILKSVPVEYNSHREHWSEGRYITYIREDGTEFTKEVKAEPDQY